MLSVIPAEIWQFGVAGLMFIVWYATNKQSNETFAKVSESSNETITALAEKTSQSYDKNIEDSRTLNKDLMELIRTNAKEAQEVNSHLIRILSRMEEKLDQPLRCPAHINTNRSDS